MSACGKCWKCREDRPCIREVQYDPKAMPTRRNTKPPRQTQFNSYEKGVPADHRGMPYLGHDLQPMGQKTVNRRRREIDNRQSARREAGRDSPKE